MAIDLYPHNPKFYLARAIAYQMINQIPKAIADCDAVIQMGEETSVAYSMRATCRLLQQDYQNALSDVNEAIKVNPDDPQVYHLRGEINDKLKNYNEAKSDFQRYLDLKSTINSTDINYKVGFVPPSGLDDTLFG